MFSLYYYSEVVTINSASNEFIINKFNSKLHCFIKLSYFIVTKMTLFNWSPPVVHSTSLFVPLFTPTSTGSGNCQVGSNELPRERASCSCYRLSPSLHTGSCSGQKTSQFNLFFSLKYFTFLLL